MPIFDIIISNFTFIRHLNRDILRLYYYYTISALHRSEKEGGCRLPESLKFKFSWVCLCVCLSPFFSSSKFAIFSIAKFVTNFGLHIYNHQWMDFGVQGVKTTILTRGFSWWHLKNIKYWEERGVACMYRPPLWSPKGPPQIYII